LTGRGVQGTVGYMIIWLPLVFREQLVTRWFGGPWYSGYGWLHDVYIHILLLTFGLQHFHLVVRYRSLPPKQVCMVLGKMWHKQYGRVLYSLLRMVLHGEND
jgi:hypothetical protein